MPAQKRMKNEPIKHTEKTIQRLLASRHTKDVFITNVKTGSSWGVGCQQIDAWAMKRSWAHPLISGYEIKISRGDFMRDEKWREYLHYCNAFYFVCPHGIIQPEELPAEAGLLVVSKGGLRLFTKKKAPHREVTVPEEMWRHIIMSRTRITRGIGGDPEKQTGRERWTEWLKHKKIDRQFGYDVGKALAKKINFEIHEARKKNKQLQNQMKEYADIKAFIEEELGVKLNEYSTESLARKEARRRLEIIPKNLSHNLVDLKRNIETVIRDIEIFDKK